MSIRNILALTFVAVQVASPLYARATSARADLRRWVFAQPVTRCFPGFIDGNFLSVAPRMGATFGSSFRPSERPRQAIPMNLWTSRAFSFSPSPLLSEDVFSSTGTNANIHVTAGALDPEVSEVALDDGYYELREFVLIGRATNVPRSLHRRALHISFGGIAIGSRKRDVEVAFGYRARLKAAESLTRCGMVAEGFQMQGSVGASSAYIFIFRDGQVVAVDYESGA
jgi:hypothetical protein